MITHAVIPAGGFLDAAYRKEAGVEYRALAPIGGIPTLQRVVNSLRDAGIEHIVAVADPAVQERISGVDVWAQASSTGSANILLGMQHVPQASQVLMCPCDLPDLDPDDIRRFLSGCEPETDLMLGLVSADAYLAAYPDGPPSEFIALRDFGLVGNSSALIVRPSVLLGSGSLLKQCFESRKSQVRLALLLGPRLLWAYCTRSLTAAGVISRVESVLGCRAGVIADAPPGLSFDIDTVHDYIYARSRIGLSHGNASPEY